MKLMHIAKRFIPGASNSAPARPEPAAGLTIKNMGDGRAAIYIYDDIGPDWAGMIGAETVRRELADLGDGINEIDLHVNSRGGSVVEGQGIYNLLKDHPAKINSIIDGVAASTSGWICMAGDNISIAENGYFILHDPTNIVSGGAADLRKAADTLDETKNLIARIFSSRTDIEAGEIEDMMLAETWIVGKDAVDRGFADELSPNKAVNCSLDFDCFNNVPGDARSLAGDSPDDRPATITEIRAMLAEVAENRQPEKINSESCNTAEIGASDAELKDEMSKLMV